MSIMNSAEAARLALDEAAQHLDNVIVIYVEPDKNAKPLSFTRRLTLPETDDVQLPFAMGCAKAGALPVLDLHALEDASERFAAALCSIGADKLPPMVIRVSDRHPAPIAGAQVIAPKNPRELAGALRYALRSGGLCVIAENPLDAYASCDVPDDWDELFSETLPSGDVPATAIDSIGETAPEATDSVSIQTDESAAIDSTGETAPEAADDARTQANEPDAPVDSIGETTPEAADGARSQSNESDTPVDSFGETVPEAADDTPAESPVRLAMPAFRSRRYDPAELERTAALLDISRDALVRLCCQSVEALAEVVIESDAAPGEIACLPPRVKAACLWVGADVLSLCWDPERLDNDAARALLNTASAYLALPARLILDKEK